MNTTFMLGAAITLTLGSLVPAQAQTSRQEADLQRRNMREYLSFQRHYQEELQKVQDTLLEENENLQFHYSESVISEGTYLEANSAYEKLEAGKLALLPESKVLQGEVVKIQQTLRQPGKTPQSRRGSSYRTDAQSDRRSIAKRRPSQTSVERPLAFRT